MHAICHLLFHIVRTCVNDDFFYLRIKSAYLFTIFIVNVYIQEKAHGDNSCVSGVTLAYHNRNHYRKILLRMASIHSIPASHSPSILNFAKKVQIGECYC